jgi:hypothetical protein
MFYPRFFAARALSIVALVASRFFVLRDFDFRGAIGEIRPM